MPRFTLSQSPKIQALTVMALLVLYASILSGPSSCVLATAGDLDPTFGTGGRVFTHIGFGDRVTSLAFQPDGKIIAAGASGNRGIFYASDFALVRYNADGSIDTSFGAAGKVTTDFFDYEDYINAVALQADGKIVAAGRARNGALPYFGLARYNRDGSLDSTFGSGGKVVTSFFGYGDDAHALAIQPDGKIVVAGSDFSSNDGADFGLARYNTDGSLDLMFGAGGKVHTDFGGFSLITCIALQPDGKIVAGGDTIRKKTNTDFALARYNKDGSLDSSFGSAGTVVTDFTRQPDFVDGLALQPDLKIVVAGDVFTDQGDAHGFGLARYNQDGSLDSGFGSGGKVITEGELIGAYAVAIQPNGKIIAAGLARRSFSDGDFALARYNSNGGLDPSFGLGGIICTDFTPSDQVFAMGLQSDGKVVVAGSAYDVQLGNGFALARYDAGDITTRTYDTHVQNDTSLLQFDSVSGDYSFTDCVSGFTLTGVGKVKTHGCKTTVLDGGADFEVWVKINVCTSAGKASIQVFPQGLSYSVKDGDITKAISPCR